MKNICKLNPFFFLVIVALALVGLSACEPTYITPGDRGDINIDGDVNVDVNVGGDTIFINNQPYIVVGGDTIAINITIIDSSKTVVNLGDVNVNVAGDSITFVSDVNVIVEGDSIVINNTTINYGDTIVVNVGGDSISFVLNNITENNVPVMVNIEDKSQWTIINEIMVKIEWITGINVSHCGPCDSIPCTGDSAGVPVNWQMPGFASPTNADAASYTMSYPEKVNMNTSDTLDHGTQIGSHVFAVIRNAVIDPSDSTRIVAEAWDLPTGYHCDVEVKWKNNVTKKFTDPLAWMGAGDLQVKLLNPDVNAPQSWQYQGTNWRTMGLRTGRQIPNDHIVLKVVQPSDPMALVYTLVPAGMYINW